MNRNPSSEDMNEDDEINSLEFRSSDRADTPDYEETKTYQSNPHKTKKRGMYISLTSIQAEAVTKHIPNTFMLVERSKLKQYVKMDNSLIRG